jgi:hypothetical protein
MVETLLEFVAKAFGVAVDPKAGGGFPSATNPTRRENVPQPLKHKRFCPERLSISSDA